MTQEEFHKRYQYNPNTDCLGEGGFGKVYKAYDTHLNHYVAIKMAEVKPHLEEVRLRKEVDLVNKLPSHPNIAHYEACYTYSTFAGEYDFGVLQYYDQGNLQQLITNKQLTYYQKDSMLKQILDGIVFLHSHGIIHRDLKPHNILIALNHNGVYVPKITDFGISKKLDVNKSSVFTNSLAGAGTLSFASPEQLLGNTIRKNTDLWSFGVIACWIFTGKLPFNSGSLAATSEAGRIELFKQITAGEITAMLTQIPADWRGLVRQCLVVDVDRRVSGAGKCLEILSGKVIVEEIKDTTATKVSHNQQNGNQKTNYEQTKAEDKEYKPVNKKLKPNYSTIWIILAVIFVGWAIISYVKTKAKPAESASMIDSTLVGVDTDVTTENKNINPIAENETVKDVDGNVYKTVKIGNQVWMAENLKVTHYRNGDAIPNVIENDEWSKMTTGAYCNYDNNTSIDAKYGVLYNWFAVSDTRYLAPDGWHIPTDDEWTNMINYIGGESVAGEKLKEEGTDHWVPFSRESSIKGVDSYGFSALPGGYRFSDAKYFGSIGEVGNWWTFTQGDKNNAWSRRMGSYYNEVSRINYNKNGGFSVRCVRN